MRRHVGAAGTKTKVLAPEWFEERTGRPTRGLLAVSSVSPLHQEKRPQIVAVYNLRTFVHEAAIYVMNVDGLKPPAAEPLISAR